MNVLERAWAPIKEKGVLACMALLLTVLMSAATVGTSTVGAQDVDFDRFSAMKARAIGPAGMSGRIAAIDAVESDPNTIYVGAATGGVWKSVNGGQTWASIFDDQRVLGIGSVAIFQASPDIVWVGTGEGNPRNSAGVGAGIYKTMDGGKTWTFLGLEASERVHRIVLHPSDPDIAYAGVMGPAWSDGQERGVYRTTDGGRTWDRVLFVNESAGISDLIMDPENPNKLLAGMWHFRRWPWFFESGGEGSGLFITWDGGDSWTRLTEEDGLPEGELGRIGLTIARNDPNVVYALVEARRSALLRSDDGGVSWQAVNTERGVASRPFYYTDIFVDPSNELRLYNLHSRVMRSEDGGKSFQSIGNGVHSDFHALWIDPNDSRLMYIGTDGGVYVTRDRGDHWRFVDNLPVGQFYHVSVDMEIPFNIYGGMQDNGSWRGPSDLWENGGIRNYHWMETHFGDGFGTLVDPSDPDWMFAMSQGGNLSRVDLRTGERKGIRPWAPDSVELRFNWNAAIAADPFETGTIYYGSQFVHKTSDRGSSWQIISGDLTSNDPEKQKADESGGLTRDATGAENHTTLITISPSPVEREVIWAGSDDGKIHITRSGGGQWDEVGQRIRRLPEGIWVPHIEASKHVGGRAYVVAEDHRRGDWTPYIFRTEDYGRRWENIAEDTDLWGFVHTLEEDLVAPNLLFAGTEFGLWISFDFGETWTNWRHGVPPAPVRSLVIHPRDHDLVVGTHGRALYVLDDIRPLRALARDPTLLTTPVHFFEPPPAYLRSASQVDGYHFSADAMFEGETRPAGALLTYSVGPSVEADEVEIKIIDEVGDTLRTMTGPAEAGLNRVTWNLREDSPPAPAETARGGRGGFRVPGAEVLPGSYRIQIRVGGDVAAHDVEVLPDPRIEIPMDVRRSKQTAVRRALAMTTVLQKIQAGNQELTQALNQLDEVLGDDRNTHADLRSLADEVRGELGEIGSAMGELNRFRRAMFSLGASRDAPTEGERIALSRMEEGLGPLLGRFNGLIQGRLPQLRQAVRSANFDLIPEIEPVRREGGF